MTELQGIPEGPREKDLFPLKMDTVRVTINKFREDPSTYIGEWRYLTSAQAQKNIVQYMAGTLDQETINYETPFSGDEQHDNYVRGALAMHRILRNQAEIQRVELPEITQDILDHYIKEINAKKSGSTAQEKFLSIRENARRSLTEDSIDLITELNRLTGEINLDVSYGAADVYNLVKIALANKKKDSAYEYLYGTVRSPSELEPIYRPKKTRVDIPVIRKDNGNLFDRESFDYFALDGEPLLDAEQTKEIYGRLGITGMVVCRITGPNSRFEWVITRPLRQSGNSGDEKQSLVKATYIQYDRKGWVKKVGKSIDLNPGVGGLCLVAPKAKSDDLEFLLEVDESNIGHLEIKNGNPTGVRLEAGSPLEIINN